MSVQTYEYTLEDDADHSARCQVDVDAPSGLVDYKYNPEPEVSPETSAALSWTYGYGPSNLASSTLHEEEANATGKPVDWVYDRAGEVLPETPTPGPAPTVLGFGYDAFGNAWCDWLSDASPTRHFFADALTLDGQTKFSRIGASGDEDWMLNDKLRSIRDIVDGSGVTLWRRHWAQDDEAERYGWKGREWESEKELHYCHARYYDPTLGQWISQDPMGFDAGDGNVYRYVRNHPNLATDPSGLQDDPSVPVRFLKDYSTLNPWQKKARDLLKAKVDLTKSLYSIALDTNKVITAQHAEMFLKNESLYQWAGMAAYASNLAGQSLEKGAGFFAKRLSRNAKEGFFMVAAGNLLIFDDIYWQFLAYNSGGITELEKYARDIPRETMTGWQYIEAGRKSKTDTVRLVRQGTLRIGIEEQRMLQTAVISQDPALARELSVFAQDAPFPGARGFFPRDFSRLEDRIEYLREELLNTTALHQQRRALLLA